MIVGIIFNLMNMLGLYGALAYVEIIKILMSLGLI